MRDARRRLLNPLDAVRRGLTRGLSVAALDPRVRRRGRLRAKITIEDPQRLGVLEVGLVCTEYFECLASGLTSAGGVPAAPAGRTTGSAVAFERWQPLDAVAGEQEVVLEVPADAPFSYAGDVLTYVWEIAVRGDRKGRPDAQARQEIVVLP